MRGRFVVVLTIALAICTGFSDPPRGWNSLSDPEFGFSFNYPGEFRLLSTKDLTHRVLEQRESKARIEFDVLALSELPSNQDFITKERAQAVDGTFKLVEDKPLWCIVAYRQGQREIYRKSLKGSRYAYILTIAFNQDSDPKKQTANAQTSVRIGKSLRRMG
jgi:hypothetical protein